MQGKTLIALIMAVTMTVSVSAVENKVIYGDDNRLDLYEATDSLHLDLARSTAAMISNSKISTINDITTITGTTLSSRGICKTAKFAKQMTAANCSGFLVGEDLLVTAGHCIRTQSDCDASSWVFDFAVEVNGESAAKVPASSVYKCKSIVSRDLDRRSKDDFALIRLHKKVTDRPALKVRTEGKIADNTAIVVIGHPTGLPTKVAAGSNVRSNSNGVYFIANLDTFGGNSGSAVFDANTGTVEGILVRGETDYVYDSAQGCRLPKQCTNEGCRGEDVTRITNIKKLIDILANQK
jgi:V8-like Glu-specific endopeptidase